MSLEQRVKDLEAKYVLRGHCHYCGVPISPLRRTCVEHSDLIRLDAAMTR